MPGTDLGTGDTKMSKLGSLLSKWEMHLRLIRMLHAEVDVSHEGANLGLEGAEGATDCLRRSGQISGNGTSELKLGQ